MKNNSLEEWLNYIERLHPKEIELGLERIEPLYHRIIKEPLADKIIVVGGTNGKGTTVEYLSKLIRSDNKTVGTYTSPHLFDFNERIRINGEKASNKEIVRSFREIDKVRGSTQLTYFEFTTLVAFDLLYRKRLDVVVLEIGLGGRLDAVNVVNSDISILTNVELDHQDWLGNDKEAIGLEKAAIFRNKKPAILAHENFPNSVLDQANKIGAEIFRLGREFRFEVSKDKSEWDYFLNAEKHIESSIQNIEKSNLSIESASAALTAYALLGGEITKEKKEVIQETFLTCRCELINKRFLVDVSHNPASIRYLVDFIKEKFKTKKFITAVFGVMSDKDVRGMIQSLLPLVDYWYATSPNIDRAMNPKEIISILQEEGISEAEEVKKVSEAVSKADKHSPEEGLVLIFGSFYTLSEAVPLLNSFGP